MIYTLTQCSSHAPKVANEETVPRDSKGDVSMDWLEYGSNNRESVKLALNALRVEYGLESNSLFRLKEARMVLEYLGATVSPACCSVKLED